MFLCHTRKCMLIQIEAILDRKIPFLVNRRMSCLTLEYLLIRDSLNRNPKSNVRSKSKFTVKMATCRGVGK